MREFLQPVKNGELFPLLFLLLRLRVALLFVTLRFLLHFQLCQFPLPLLFLRTLLALTALLPRHLKLMLRKFQQRIVSGLLGGQRIG